MRQTACWSESSASTRQLFLLPPTADSLNKSAVRSFIWDSFKPPKTDAGKVFMQLHSRLCSLPGDVSSGREQPEKFLKDGSIHPEEQSIVADCLETQSPSDFKPVCCFKPECSESICICLKFKVGFHYKNLLTFLPVFRVLIAFISICCNVFPILPIQSLNYRTILQLDIQSWWAGFSPGKKVIKSSFIFIVLVFICRIFTLEP